MTKIALVTCESLGIYTNNAGDEDDQLLRFLQQQGLTVAFEVWTNPNVDWEAYEAVVVKSPWDYFDRIGDFYKWIKSLEDKKIRVLNPAPVLRWNADKLYLKEIEASGIPIIPTYWIEKGAPFQPDTIFHQLRTDTIIVKPRVSGGSKNTFSIRQEEAHGFSNKLNALFTSAAYLAQPFLPQVQTQGEWSFVFFGGNYSHCVLKTAKTGDFRVQHYLGGSIHPQRAPAHLLRQATRVVEKFAAQCLYARVDGLEADGQLLLMELELIEPFLFLFTNPRALDNYYDALLRVLYR